MAGYSILDLNDMLAELGEDKVKSILSSFTCPLNKDVEYFLKAKAIEFSKQSLSNTHLVFVSYKNKPELIGYFTLANKYLKASRTSLSKRCKTRISRFCQYDDMLREYILPSPLIAQLGKNHKNNLNTLITGDELLKMACDKVRIVHSLLGGKYVYLECEDKPKLIEFYKSNGFIEFDKRLLERDEIEKLDGKYLVQMIKIFNEKTGE